MGTNPTKAADNIYCKCRKEAAKYNDKLNSREGAAELLGISASTLADYELGITKIIPADAILRMADLYNAPELRNHYCKSCIFKIHNGFMQCTERYGKRVLGQSPEHPRKQPYCITAICLKSIKLYYMEVQYGKQF